MWQGLGSLLTFIWNSWVPGLEWDGSIFVGLLREVYWGGEAALITTSVMKA